MTDLSSDNTKDAEEESKAIVQEREVAAEPDLHEGHEPLVKASVTAERRSLLVPEVQLMVGYLPSCKSPENEGRFSSLRRRGRFLL
jgi:hypothetical protein